MKEKKRKKEERRRRRKRGTVLKSKMKGFGFWEA